MSYFRYCCPVWGCVGTTTLQKLQKLQNREARVAKNSCFDAPSEPLIQELGWLTTERQIELEIVIVEYKTLQNEVPLYMKNCFLSYETPKARSCVISQLTCISAF